MKVRVLTKNGREKFRKVVASHNNYELGSLEFHWSIEHNRIYVGWGDYQIGFIDGEGRWQSLVVLKQFEYDIVRGVMKEILTTYGSTTIEVSRMNRNAG